MDEVFRALSDPHRRILLDALVERDGQTLTELEGRLDLTRFGAMNHLRVLEEAGLVTTHKVGRHKFHYLNPMPIQMLSERWISKYAAPVTKAMGHLKRTLEASAMTQKPMHVYTTLIRATPEEVWWGITHGDMTRQYYFGGAVHSDWQTGSPFAYTYDDGSVVLEGQVLEVDPPRRLVTTFAASWDDAVAADPPSRVTWEIEPMGSVSKLTVTHDGFETETATFDQVGDGLPVIVSGLKTLLETGSPLPLG